MPSTIFAQFCQELENIVDISNYTVFNLYSDVDHGAILWDISQNDFLDLFYSNGIFHIHDCCNNIMQTDYWTWGREAEGGGLGNGGPANIPQQVMDQWALDASNNTVGAFHWETCSNLVVKAQLMQARNLCNLACNVCCAMTLRDIVADLNAQDHVHRTPDDPFRNGDILVLSLLFTNSSPLVNPVVFFFYFQITE